MGCTNHPNEQEIEEIEQVANQQANEVAEEAIGDKSLHQFAEERANEVKNYADKLIAEAQQSTSPLSRSDIANIESKIRQFAAEKSEEVRERSSRWKDGEGTFISRTGKNHFDRVPDNNENPDRDTIPGFHMGHYYNNPTNFGMIMKDDNEPGRSTHVHQTEVGIILSTFNANTGTIDRFNLTTGEDWTNKGEETQWPI